jgi:hypothetical protein
MGRGSLPDQRRILADAIDGPIGVTAVTGRRMIRHRAVAMIAAYASMRGDDIGLGERLHPEGRPGFDLRRPACGRCCQFSSIMAPNSDARLS